MRGGGGISPILEGLGARTGGGKKVGVAALGRGGALAACGDAMGGGKKGGGGGEVGAPEDCKAG
jgi:hypothetical protein